MKGLHQDLAKIDPEKLNAEVATCLKSYRARLPLSKIWSSNDFSNSSKELQKRMEKFLDEPNVAANALMIVTLLGYCDYLRVRNDKRLLPKLYAVMLGNIPWALQVEMYDRFEIQIGQAHSYFESTFEKSNLMGKIGGPTSNTDHTYGDDVLLRLDFNKNNKLPLHPSKKT